MNAFQLSRKTAATLLAGALTPSLAFAHPGHGLDAPFVAGVLHPLTGLDHVLMIVAVGAWAAALVPSGRLVVVACLALFVGAGSLLPVGGGPALEAAIALTVVGAGTLLAAGRRLPIWTTSILAAAFAVIHGFAHGAEGPGRDGLYIAGLMFSTAVLALAATGVAGLLLSRPTILRVAGVASAALSAATLAS
jgi:urease accessory protein